MKINIHGLAQGLHSFQFEAQGSELDLDVSSFRNEIRILSDVEKKHNDLFVKTRVLTLATFVCDKCLEEFSGELRDEFRLMYTADSHYKLEDDDTVILLSSRTREIDLSHGVRECLLLAVPMKTTCSEDCQGLCSKCGANLNVAKCKCTEDRIDRRWQGLEKLINSAESN